MNKTVVPHTNNPISLIKTYLDNLESEGALEVRRELVEEYNVSTVGEKVVIDFAVSAYLRLLECSKIYSSILNPEVKYSYDEDTEEEKEDGWSYSYNQNKINLLKVLGNQINMANQQYMSAITFLKESKRPPLNVKIHTKQAFVAENQQFNKNA